MNVCLKCQIETKNKKFCSRSCAVSYNNSVAAKRKAKVWSCVECGCKVVSRRKYCDFCYQENCRVDYDAITLADVKLKAGSRNSYHTLVRQHARRVCEQHGKLLSCCLCDYSAHVEACHLRDVADFPLTAKLSEVNSDKNLVGLCPNHHWELDNGALDSGQRSLLGL